jgi:hypothetical protein
MIAPRRTSSITIGVILLFVPTAVACTCDDGGPLNVFLLDGQSNMVGMGSLQHLKILLDDAATHHEYAHLWNTSSDDWAERSDVYIKFDDQIGKLKAGRGAAPPSSTSTTTTPTSSSSTSTRTGHIGPELEFGWVLGDHFLHSCPCHQPLLLLKAAYGGRNLAIDFRPPLSGIGNYTGVKPIHYGWEYRDMITTIQNTLDHELPHIVPNYNKDTGYKLSGFVWFQGWNDMLNWDMVKEYEYNLANLIRSVRLDLDAPDLPVIIGELGMHGLHPTGRGADRVMAMRAAERRVTEQEEFKTTSLYVPTAPYVVDNGTSYNGNYHYNGRADTYCHIGQAFGRAMLKLWKRNTTSSGTTASSSKDDMLGSWASMS